ncbi:MAG: chromate transporter [Erysipelotrichaceae bacterium]
MKKDFNFYFKLFRATFSLSAFTFGGGYVIVPLMRRKFVDDYHWIDEKEMIDMVAIAQSAPGAMAVNTSILVGYRLAKIKGALVSVLGTVLPPLIILSIISMFYASFRDNEIVSAVMKGMQAGVAAIIVDVVITMGMNVFQEKNKLSNIMMPTVFIAAYFFNVNVMFLILICGSISLLYPFIKQKMKGDQTI